MPLIERLMEMKIDRTVKMKLKSFCLGALQNWYYHYRLPKLSLTSKQVGLPYNRSDWFHRFDKARPPIKRVEAFYSAKFDILKKINLSGEDVILITLCKNEIDKLREFLPYYRKLGVKRFVVIDNVSTDGSVEWLAHQPDVFLLQIRQEYRAERQDAWYNRVMAWLGDNRWYLVVDSDEFLTYPGMEEHSIGDLIEKMTREKLTHVRGFMLDMYARPGYAEKGQRSCFMEECVCFDTDSYRKEPHTWRVFGGPRPRIMGRECLLTKFPLVYLQSGEFLINSHQYYPFESNAPSPLYLVLRHYKFLPGDLERYRDYVKTGIHWQNSMEYKIYVNKWEEEGVIDFSYPGSACYETSQSLKKIKILQEILW